MLESLRTLKRSFHAKFSKTLAIKRLVNSDNFELAYTNADEPTKKLFCESVKREDRTTIRSLIKRELSKLTPFHEMNMGKLRAIGRNLKIPDYKRLNKSFLIREIEHVVERLKEGGERSSVQSKQTHTDTESSA